MIPASAQKIIDFWFKETPSELHFKKDENLDQKIKDKFLKDHESASQNKYDDWQDNPMSCLALVIIFDQFSRNIFRNNKKAFAQDYKARLIVNEAVYSGYLETINESQRLFMILPLIHSEEINDHDMAYYLLNKYLKDYPDYNQIKKLWKDHTNIIRRFHRYPHRNQILERSSTNEEIEFLKISNSSW